jgi:hypothetical protein
MIPITLPPFELGAVVATPGAVRAFNRTGQSPWEFLSRHMTRDWGECGEHDRAANDRAIEDGDRIFSTYQTKAGETIWVITEADRASTCLLLPDEY